MKNSSNFLSILFLSFLILIGSIVEFNSHLIFSVNPHPSNSAEEIEGSSDLIIPLVDLAPFDFSLILLDLPTHFVLTGFASQFHSTVPQLLCSNRIALPPPSFIN